MDLIISKDLNLNSPHEPRETFKHVGVHDKNPALSRFIHDDKLTAIKREIMCRNYDGIIEAFS